MKLGESVLGFHDSYYREKISDREYTYATLAANIYRKRRAIASSKRSAMTGAAAVHVTAGMSLIGAAWSARSVAVGKNKLQLLEEEWARRGQKKLRNRGGKDPVIRVRITGPSGAIEFSIDLTNSHETEEGAQAAAEGTPEYEFNGHLVGAYHVAVKKGVENLGDAPSPAVHSLSYNVHTDYNSDSDSDD